MELVTLADCLPYAVYIQDEIILVCVLSYPGALPGTRAAIYQVYALPESIKALMLLVMTLEVDELHIIRIEADAQEQEKVTGLITACGTLIAYIVGEGLVDKENKE